MSQELMPSVNWGVTGRLVDGSNKEDSGTVKPDGTDLKVGYYKLVFGGVMV